MFTGIIEAIGTIQHISSSQDSSSGDLCVSILSNTLDLNDVDVGDSIAVNGVCLTVTSIEKNSFTVNISQETLKCSCGLDQLNTPVNLEKAMRLSDRLGGHFVSGHVDDTGEVTTFKSLGESVLLIIKAPLPLLKYIVKKGSITVNGVSLTINEVNHENFSINLIPHTLAATTLSDLQPGIPVNLETDMLARYVAQIMKHE